MEAFTADEGNFEKRTVLQPAVFIAKRGNVLRCEIHRDELHCVFKCVGVDCKQTSCTYIPLKII